MTAPVLPIKRIVSGGQSGADRAGLDWAIEHGFPHGGWCPKGRLAEDGPIPERYKLKETPLGDYLQRTEWNGCDSDGTVVFSISPVLTGGSLKTVDFAMKHKKPVIHISSKTEQPGNTLQAFIRTHQIRTLNVAGSRASEEPGIAVFVKQILELALLGMTGRHTEN
jgi:hypothetical protein